MDLMPSRKPCMTTRQFVDMSILILTILLSLQQWHVEGASRTATVNSALRLECREGQTIMVKGVKLGRSSPRCSYSLRSDHVDYQRVVRECSGRQSCSNILVQNALRIPCGSRHADADLMEVNYSCLPDYNLMNICHNTGRTSSPFSGFLSSPNYPEVAQDMESMTCRCEIQALSANARIQLLLIDLRHTNQLKLSYPRMDAVPLCYKPPSGRCINVIHSTAENKVNLTYTVNSAEQRNSRFLLQFSATGHPSRVRAVCHMIVQENTTPSMARKKETTISLMAGTAEANPTDLLIELEVIAGIVAAGVAIILIVVIIFILRYKKKTRKSSNITSSIRSSDFQFLTKSKKETLSYEIIRDGHQYESIRRVAAAAGHHYHEPAEPNQEERKYYDPCADDYQSEDYNDEGIYESIQNIPQETSSNPNEPRRPVRYSKMTKSSSMPKYPAPPVPRIKPYAAPPTRSAGAREDNSITRPSTVVYDVPPRRPSGVNAESCGSLDSIPNLDIDFTDFLKETNKRFQNSTSDYLQPISLIEKNDEKTPNPSGDSEGCHLVFNELYNSK